MNSRIRVGSSRWTLYQTFHCSEFWTVTCGLSLCYCDVSTNQRNYLSFRQSKRILDNVRISDDNKSALLRIPSSHTKDFHTPPVLCVDTQRRIPKSIGQIRLGITRKYNTRLLYLSILLVSSGRLGNSIALPIIPIITAVLSSRRRHHDTK